MIPERLKLLRERKNLTKTELAKQLGMPYTTYVNYETGTREPGSDFLIKIAQFYKVSIDYIMGVQDDFDDSQLTTPFADRIKKAMELRGLTQTELVKRTGIGKSSISTYLNGEYEPKQKNTYKLAKVLNVNESWLLGYDVPMERTETDKDIPSSDNILSIKPQAQVIGQNGERIIFNDENLNKDIVEILSRIAPDYSPIVNDSTGEILSKISLTYNISDNKGNKIELDEREYNFLINVLNTFRDSTK